MFLFSSVYFVVYFAHKVFFIDFSECFAFQWSAGVAKGFAGGAMEFRIRFYGSYITYATFHNKAAKVRIPVPFAALNELLIRLIVKMHT